jgi:hypothetical protein
MVVITFASAVHCNGETNMRKVLLQVLTLNMRSRGEERVTGMQTGLANGGDVEHYLLCYDRHSVYKNMCTAALTLFSSNIRSAKRILHNSQYSRGDAEGRSNPNRQHCLSRYLD